MKSKSTALFFSLILFFYLSLSASKASIPPPPPPPLPVDCSTLTDVNSCNGSCTFMNDAQGTEEPGHCVWSDFDPPLDGCFCSSDVVPPPTYHNCSELSICLEGTPCLLADGTEGGCTLIEGICTCSDGSETPTPTPAETETPAGCTGTDATSCNGGCTFQNEAEGTEEPGHCEWVDFSSIMDCICISDVVPPPTYHNCSELSICLDGTPCMLADGTDGGCKLIDGNCTCSDGSETPTPTPAGTDTPEPAGTDTPEPAGTANPTTDTTSTAPLEEIPNAADNETPPENNENDMFSEMYNTFMKIFK